MAQKTSSSTITSTEVRELLKTAARKLSAREEKVARMLSGASIAKDQPLPRRGQNHPEARAELMALELELKRKLEMRKGTAEVARAEPAPAVRTKEKEKIIRALRRLK
jgi:hypothetical protein